MKAYLVYFTIFDPSGISLKYPIGPVFTSTREIAYQSQIFRSIISRTWEVDEQITIVPLFFKRLYPLRMEFWKKPTIHYDDLQRVHLFESALLNYGLYKLIVTPFLYQKQTIFLSAIPMYTSATDYDIERFMTLSDFPLEESAKYAAIYTFGKPQTLDRREEDILPYDELLSADILEEI